MLGVGEQTRIRGWGLAAQVVGCGSKQDDQGRPCGQGDSKAKTDEVAEGRGPGL